VGATSCSPRRRLQRRARPESGRGSVDHAPGTPGRPPAAPAAPAMQKPVIADVTAQPSKDPTRPGSSRVRARHAVDRVAAVAARIAVVKTHRIGVVRAERPAAGRTYKRGFGAPRWDAPRCPKVEPASWRPPPDAGYVSARTFARCPRRPVPAESCRRCAGLRSVVEPELALQRVPRRRERRRRARQPERREHRAPGFITEDSQGLEVKAEREALGVAG
jgi:hypothetical protein